MPSGYTAALYDGEQSFEDFVLGCAHAFFYDSSVKSALPETIEPSMWHEKALREARKHLGELAAMTDEEAQAAADAAYAHSQAEEAEYLATTTARAERYRAVLAQVERWQPPSEGHESLKAFMLQQLTESIEFDGPHPSLWPHPPRDGTTWLNDEIAHAQRNVAYHTEEWNKDQERAAEQTAWLRALRESLGVKA